MARVTVEDCVLKVPNRFELVMLAAQRAREVASGAPLTVDRDNDKNPVVALREIADETVSLDYLKNSLIKGHQKIVEPEEPEEEIAELMASEQDWITQSADDMGGLDGDDALGEDGLDGDTPDEGGEDALGELGGDNAFAADDLGDSDLED